MNFLLVIIFSATLAFSSEVEEAKTTVKALIQPLIASSATKKPSGDQNFRVDQCERYKLDWMALLLRQQETVLKFTFKKGCDIEGVIHPAIFTPFPASLKLRNLEAFNQVDTVNKVTVNLENRPIINIELRQGNLRGKKANMKFEADYKLRLNVVNGKQQTENMGGEIYISELNGKKTNIREKIYVK